MSFDNDGRTFRQENMVPVTYRAVREAMNGAMFPFTVRDANEVKAVLAAVNQGIDSHLEACFVPDESDGYTPNGKGLDCIISEHSLPVFLRRLYELDTGDEAVDDAGMSLASSIMTCLGFNDCGVFVGREALE
jgi:hypothetical protein